MSCVVVGAQQYRTVDGSLQEVIPAACPEGHPYVVGTVMLGWCGSHRYYDCGTCRRERMPRPRVCYRTRG